MRILALLTDADDAPGGIAQYNRDLLDACARSEACAAIRVCAYTRHPPRVASTRAKSRYAWAGSSRARFALTSVWQARRFKPDVVLCGHLHLSPVAAVAARASGATSWLQVHGIDAWSPPEDYRLAQARRAEWITAVSRFTRLRVSEWWSGAPERLRVLPNTVHERFSPGAPDVARLSALGLRDQGYLLTVGRLASGERYKGQDRVLREWPRLSARFPDLVYAIAGDGDDAARLRAIADELGIAERVRFLGQVDGDDLVTLYRGARGFAMPSTGEGFGIAFLEAMACGTPALGLDGDGSRDPLRDGVAGIVCTESGLGEALMALLDPARPRGEDLSKATRAVFGRAPFEARVDLFLRELQAHRSAA